ncbi:MinD/ParA family protein [Eubacterium oxidoreducens]|uniref:Flagellar biosynthesis protein FlhG n=1 Tax=Eubacterium oxidoreducens TaxID=1732 RepID=A0A1G6APS1_EUBOX|nr:MinD/ParA family protein [Eubacterium oxidoreducens]SDB10355.1 flagellar biosynthesis protein FlhG [Eubacterium oxidoreducens]
MDQAEGLRNIIKAKNQRESQPARVITITSGKGGVGKSNLAVNLAVQLRKKGKKVIIFDADFGLANVEVMFGSIPKYNLSDLIYRDKSMEEIITKGPMGVDFVSGGNAVAGLNNLTKEQIEYLVRSLSQLDYLADIILIDTGAGISDAVMEFVLASPEVLLVSTPEPSSLTDSYSLLKSLYHSPKFSQKEAKVRVIANKVHSREDGLEVFHKLDTVVHQFLSGSIEYLGMIPADLALEKAIREQKPISMKNPNARSARAFELLASKLLDENISNEIKIRRGFSGIFADLIYSRS